MILCIFLCIYKYNNHIYNNVIYVVYMFQLVSNEQKMVFRALQHNDRCFNDSVTVFVDAQ